MIPRVYIETTIPSFYHETRSEPEIVARRQWTREWWDDEREQYHLVTSAAVIAELSQGTYPHQTAALQLIDELEILDIDEAVEQIVDEYIAQRLMPADPTGDALHLALASYHRCDFLATWNCRHLANARKFDHIEHENRRLGLSVPRLVTPLELLGANP
jgi:predicted nucleic acid-binding protein